MSSQGLMNSPIVDKSSALDLIFGFLQLAQRRGAFSFPESSKIYECIQQFDDFFQNEPKEEEKEDEKEDPTKEEKQTDELDEQFDSDEEKES